MVFENPGAGPGTEPAGAQTPRAEDIEMHVTRGAQGRIYDLRVECDGARLVLSGRCRTYYAKQLAQQAALELAASATRVINRIAIM